MKSSPYLFTYGTLMRGWRHDAARLLHQKSKFLGTAHISGHLYDLGDFPGLIYDPESQLWVKGQLFEMADPERMIPFFDYYEGTSPTTPEQGLFQKQHLPVQHESGIVHSWVYTYNREVDAARLIDSGDYRAYVQRNNSES